MNEQRSRHSANSSLSHCDGPFYKGKHVAVVGGGNSGIEAAIDLAGICSKVTVLEFMDELKADQVLQEKAKSLPKDRKSTRLNSSHTPISRMPSSA